MTAPALLVGAIFPVDFSGAKTAEDVFRIAKAADPERFRALEERLPISSPDDEYRHKNGIRRPHREKEDDGLGPHGSYVPKSMRRKFTDEEWATASKAWRLGQRELKLDYGFAKELADDGM